jgi:hypothetical protein
MSKIRRPMLASVLTEHATWRRMWEEDLAKAAAAGVSAHPWARAG